MADVADVAEQPDVHRRGDCRLCGSADLDLVLALTPTPPANAFIRADAIETPQKTYPLDVFMCRDCAHVQLLDVVDPRALFEHYVYVSGTSPVFVKHFEDYADAVLARIGTDTDGFVLDIGSNDGTLLKAFKERGMAVQGVDPAQEIAAEATRQGIDTVADFFTTDLARRLKNARGDAAAITANNVFAHADDLGGIADGIKALLAPAGLFVFEVSYLLDVYEQVLFDTIYHEHVAYHSVKPLRGFLAAHGLKLVAVDRIGSHGGSIRVWAGHEDGPWDDEASVASSIAEEEAAGLDKGDTLQAFGARIDAVGASLKAELAALKDVGKSIAGFGAPAKATTLMYHFGIGADVVDFIVDDSPLKQGLYSPGAHIPVLPSDALYERRPDAVVVLAWNFADPIIDKHQRFLHEGGRFIVPLPELRII